MKKVIALLLVVAMCCCLFAACGEKAPTSTPADKPADSGNAPADKPADQPADKPADDGKVYTLVVSNHDAATSMCELYVETLFNKIAEESGGRLQFEYNAGGSLLGATEAIDGVKDGLADITWSCTSFFSGRFPISEFINLCANGITSARMATDVYWQMWNEMPELQAEFTDWKVLGLHSCSYGPISTVGKKIETPDDFKGLQIRTAGTIAAQYIEALGATPVSVPTGEVYESVSKGVFDGFTNDWHNIDCFKLYEPIDYCLNMPVSHTSCFILMNKDSFANLPADLQAIIEKYAVNNYVGEMAGYWWDSCNYWVGDKMRENGVEVYEPSAELLAWATSEELTAPIHEWYVNYLNDAGLDGQAIYDKCMEIVEANKAAHADDWAAPFHYEDWTLTPDDLA